MNFLLRSHALKLVFPAPLIEGAENNLEQAAMWCFSCFGNLVQYATPHEISGSKPDVPLRSDSLLHISVARGDKAAVDKCLARGMPVDLLANDGLAPLHWALAARRRKLPLIGIWRQDTAMLRHLLERGSPVDVRSTEGATPLMNAIQTGTARQVKFLLDRGADPNAADAHGFTALHRAAEMGKTDMVKTLLARGAVAGVETQGHTPLSFARTRNHEAIIKLLDRN